MSKIFSNGCSFLTPRPKDGVNTYVTKHLANQYGMDIENIAMGGRGNTRISFSTKTYFEHFGTEDTFAVIGWSSAYRNDYVTNDGWKKGRMPGTDLNISFIKNNVGWDIENNAVMAFLDNVFDLQNYFERKRIPYVMYNALPNTFDSNSKDFETIKKAIDMKRFFNPTVSHLEYITDKNLIVSPADPHPSTEGHVQWAEQLKEFIDVNNLRTI